MSSSVRIHSLHLYPLKSGRALDCTQIELDADGLRHDRQWMVIDAQGRFVTQRSHPRLALVSSLVTADGALQLRAPGQKETMIPVPDLLAAKPEDALTVKVWSRALPARDAGELGAAWISTVLGEKLRLVYAAGERFTDGYPLLVCSLESLAALNERLPQPIPMSRFRPNIVLEGGAAWAEDGYRTLRLGLIELKLVKPCTRCTVTGIDQATAQAHSSPLATLKEFRYDPAVRGVTFGQNAEVTGQVTALLRVGDEVEAQRIEA